ncbi:hypothetical protein FB559_1925 [Actinoallomurus bryophytorum]|uniref:Uncharacterized protein n=1 Tax=Actinoallomurus bryophytorum TaxID=1490222 RepID=A0A543CH45_9ACTN|nr:hypothetical protein FB559_1925 [Actinoallomurus bryophytorum]
MSGDRHRLFWLRCGAGGGPVGVGWRGDPMQGTATCHVHLGPVLRVMGDTGDMSVSDARGRRAGQPAVMRMGTRTVEQVVLGARRSGRLTRDRDRGAVRLGQKTVRVVLDDLPGMRPCVSTASTAGTTCRPQPSGTFSPTRTTGNSDWGTAPPPDAAPPTRVAAPPTATDPPPPTRRRRRDHPDHTADGPRPQRDGGREGRRRDKPAVSTRTSSRSTNRSRAPACRRGLQAEASFWGVSLEVPGRRVAS